MVFSEIFIVTRICDGEEIFIIATDDEDIAFESKNYDKIVYHYHYYEGFQVERTEVKAKKKPLLLCDFISNKLQDILNDNQEINSISILTDNVKEEGILVASYNLSWCDWKNIDIPLSYHTIVAYYEFDNELRIYVTLPEEDEE